MSKFSSIFQGVCKEDVEIVPRPTNERDGHRFLLGRVRDQKRANFSEVTVCRHSLVEAVPNRRSRFPDSLLCAWRLLDFHFPKVSADDTAGGRLAREEIEVTRKGTSISSSSKAMTRV